MNDATLNPAPDARQGPEPDLVRIVQQLEPRLGHLDETPAPLDGGITNRNFRARFGDADYVIRVPGKDTSLLEIDRAGDIIARIRNRMVSARSRERTEKYAGV